MPQPETLNSSFLRPRPQRFWLKWTLWVLFAGLSLFISLNLHSRTGYFTYKSELFADKAGYYCYLPATFVYHFDGQNVPPRLPDTVGRGFYLKENGKIYTKYPIGVAVLQLPFFLVTHFVIAPLLHDPQDGFSPPYFKMVDVAAWSYLLLALLLLQKFLAGYFDSKTTYITLAAFLLGTNLFYYYAVESGMSHIYSFFLVAALLRMTQIIQKRAALNWQMALLLGGTASLLVLVRFTNGILLTIPFIWAAWTWPEFKIRLRILLGGWPTVALLPIPILLFALQASYYYYLSGSPFFYSYAQESFNFYSPQLIKVWFSPHNGLFLHAPTMLFAIGGILIMLRRRVAGAWYLTGMFILISYFFSSWWQWYFGCAYGARSFVEYYPLFMVAFAYFLQWLFERRLHWRMMLLALLILATAVTFKNGYLYKLCYPGNGDWDFAEWWKLTCLI